MSERFTEDEARRIFAHAAQRQHTDDAVAPGLSLAELQEVGRAAGLDPAHVAAAVAELRGLGPAADAPTATFLGAPVEVRATRVLSAPVTDAAWEQMVARLRRTFDTKGTPTDVGRVREWTGTNSEGGLSNLQATVEPVEGGARVILETSRAKEAKGIWAVPGTLGGFALLLGLQFAIGEFESELWALPILFLALGAISMLGVRVFFASWAAKRERQFDALLDQFELIVRDTAAEGARVSETAGPRLDLDTLSDPPTDVGRAAERRRTRG